MKVSYSINDLLCFRHECVFYGVDVLDILPLRLYQQILLDELPYRYTRASDCPKSSRLHGKLRLIPPSSYIVKINGEVRRDTVVYLCAQMYEGADDDGMGEYANSYCADSVGKVGYNETGYGTTGYGNHPDTMYENSNSGSGENLCSDSISNYSQSYQAVGPHYRMTDDRATDEKRFKYLQYFEKYISPSHSQNCLPHSPSESLHKSVSDDELGSSDSISIYINGRS